MRQLRCETRKARPLNLACLPKTPQLSKNAASQAANGSELSVWEAWFQTTEWCSRLNKRLNVSDHRYQPLQGRWHINLASHVVGYDSKLLGLSSFLATTRLTPLGLFILRVSVGQDEEADGQDNR